MEFNRVTTTLSCNMNFKLYPFGSQECNMKLASYAWQEKDVKYAWKSNTPISLGVSQANYVSLRIPSQYVIAKIPETKFRAITTSTGTEMQT